MPDHAENGRRIGVTAFKPRCLAHISDVAGGRVARILLTRHDRPIAEIVPVRDDAPTEAWGALRGRAFLTPGSFDPDA